MGWIQVLTHSTSESALPAFSKIITLIYNRFECQNIHAWKLMLLPCWTPQMGQYCAHALISVFIFWSLFSQHLEYVFVPLFALRVVAPCYPMHVIMDFCL